MNKVIFMFLFLFAGCNNPKEIVDKIEFIESNVLIERCGYSDFCFHCGINVYNVSKYCSFGLRSDCPGSRKVEKIKEKIYFHYENDSIIREKISIDTVYLEQCHKQME